MPDMGFTNFAYRAGLVQCDYAPIVIASVELRSHLGGHFCVASRHANDAGFLDVISQRLFTVDMFTLLKCR